MINTSRLVAKRTLTPLVAMSMTTPLLPLHLSSHIYSFGAIFKSSFFPPFHFYWDNDIDLMACGKIIHCQLHLNVLIWTFRLLLYLQLYPSESILWLEASIIETPNVDGKGLQLLHLDRVNDSTCFKVSFFFFGNKF